MMRRNFLLHALVFLFIFQGCAKTHSPFKVSEREFYAKTRVVALAPVVLPADLDRAELIKAKFDSLIEATLRESGLTIIPSGELAGVWKTMSERVGGVVNPDTGKRDDAKYKVVREHTLRELSGKFSVDAFLYPSIRVFKVHWERGIAKWHGVSESLKSDSFPFFSAIGILKGTAPALSLSIVVEDIYGTKLFESAGGIQLLVKLVSTYDSEPVPKDQLLADEGKNLNAVKIALGPLIPKPGR